MYDTPDETHSNLSHDLPPVVGNVPVCDGLPLDQTTCPDRAAHM